MSQNSTKQKLPPSNLRKMFIPKGFWCTQGLKSFYEFMLRNQLLVINTGLTTLLTCAAGGKKYKSTHYTTVDRAQERSMRWPQNRTAVFCAIEILFFCPFLLFIFGGRRSFHDFLVCSKYPLLIIIRKI